MMAKSRATQADVMAFIRAVYPDHAELAVASFDEATVLQEATRLIGAYREQAAEIERLRHEEMNGAMDYLALRKYSDELIMECDALRAQLAACRAALRFGIQLITRWLALDPMDEELRTASEAWLRNNDGQP